MARSNPEVDIRSARDLFPATEYTTYFNTAAVGLGSTALAAAYHGFVEEWTRAGLDYVRAERLQSRPEPRLPA